MAYTLTDMRILTSLALACCPSVVPACDLALVLAVDVSGSVDQGEYRVQMDGLAAALRDGTVVDALTDQRAQVTLIQWSGSGRQRQTLGWQQMTGVADVVAFADAIETDPRVWRNFSTAVGEALGLSLGVLEEVATCRRKVIDFSGDGVSNEGVSPAAHSAAVDVAGVVVNALAIETDDTDLTAWFFEHLIQGEGAFVITANGFDDYPDQIRRKLQRETTRQVSFNAP
jgi:Ca-activated chloride channel family protein